MTVDLSVTQGMNPEKEIPKMAQCAPGPPQRIPDLPTGTKTQLSR